MILNYANCDMVGHTGVIPAAIEAVREVDKDVGMLVNEIIKKGGRAFVTADHGNADQMYDVKKGKMSVRTAHSLNPVPFIIYDPDQKFEIKEGKYGLANVAPTIVKLLGIEAPASWEKSMI
jgi:2,3-bisphosphoglycerate-independent phosphoglycerate mutase